MRSTVQIFRYLYEHLPPLFPADIALRMKAELENLEGRTDLPLEKIEDIMIGYGYEIWPWNQAYSEFLLAGEERMGEHFLIPQLSETLRERYQDFIHLGGTLKDLHSGRPASFFTPEERNQLCAELIAMNKKLREYVEREIIGLSTKKYLAKVEDYKKVLEEIKLSLQNLKKLMENEGEHLILKDEIKDRIRHFEYSLCLLGPKMHYEAVCNAYEHFVGRKHDLNRYKGIDIPLQIDFYNS